MRVSSTVFLLPLSVLLPYGCDPADIADLERADAELALVSPVSDSGHTDDAAPLSGLTEAAQPVQAAHLDPVLDPPVLCPAHPVPTSEHAWKINQKGYLDTTVDFASFFHGPHTIMAWVMPEYTYNSYGPIFAENGGGGMYFVGQGDHAYTDASRAPVLHVSVGGKSVNYLAPSYKKREWNHVALVRTDADASGNFSFKLYVNGALLTPIGGVEISFGTSDPIPAAQVPQGDLRLGRRTSGLNDASSKGYQFYGLVDEVAVFSSALSAYNIAVYKKCGFGGSEAAMVAGLTFDSYSAQTPAGPKIEPPVTPLAPVSAFVKRLAVEAGHKSGNIEDADWFDHPLYVAPTQATYQLPFLTGEEWRVNFGTDDPNGSHRSYAAFCWDFGRVTTPAKATVSAAASGEIFSLLDTDVAVPNTREANYIAIRTAPDENLVYLHQHAGTFEEVFLGGDPLLFLPQAGPSFWIDVDQGDPLAKVGEQAKHLHFDGNTGVQGPTGVLTMPIAFTDYEVKDTSVSPPVWIPVSRGIPKPGQIIRRM